MPGLQVEGYRQLMRALQQADRESRLAIRHSLREVGRVVQADAARRFSPVNARSAAGYKVRVRQRGVAVEQSIRSTGVHPEYGALQMREALLPALYANEEETTRRMEAALDLVADSFNRGGGISGQNPD